MNKGAYIIVGSAWGDEGKGKISAYIVAREKAKFVARAGTGANAEHGIFLKDETTYKKVNQLPLGHIFDPDVQIRVGSGVAVDPQKMIKEIAEYNLSDRVKIDYRCPIITLENIKAEEESKGMSAIGSTMSGTGFCRADFVLRKASQAKEFPYLEEYLTDTGIDLNNACEKGVVVVESSQGTFLSLAVSSDYPNVTSDNVTAMAAADDVLLNWKNIKDVVLVVKSIPTREGAGSFGNAEELSPEYVQKMGWAEISSIGGAQRRTASGIDWGMLKYAVEINGATQIALTFLDHFDPEMTNVKNRADITKKTRVFIDKIERETKTNVTILETGKAFDNIIDLSFNQRLVDWDAIEKHILGV